MAKKRETASIIFLAVIAQLRKYKGQIPLYLVWYKKQNTWGTFRADITHGVNIHEAEICAQNFKSLNLDHGILIEW